MAMVSASTVSARSTVISIGKLVASRAWELDVEYPLVVSEGKEISKAYDSRMVPSTFLVDERGNLVRKFVGFKDKATLDEAFDELIDS